MFLTFLIFSVYYLFLDFLVFKLKVKIDAYIINFCSIDENGQIIIFILKQNITRNGYKDEIISCFVLLNLTFLKDKTILIKNLIYIIMMVLINNRNNNIICYYFGS